MLLNLSNIWAGYRSIKAIRGISLNVKEREIVALIGANGGGKSTLLNTTARLQDSMEGRIEFRGEDITTVESNLVIKHGLSLVPEGRGLFSTMTVTENLLMGAFSRRDRQRILGDLTYVIEKFPSLKARSHQKACFLSGGEQQMLSIARGLMSRPYLLMMDEPSWGLAPLLIRHVFKICVDLCEGGTSFLIAEQDAFNVLRCAHRGYVIENGLIVLSGSGEELLRNEEIKKYYLGM